jgi:hypothetical protein
LVRRTNIEHVFRAIGSNGPISRSQLVRATGLSKPTVLGLVTALEAEGLIRGVSLASVGVGRTPIVYEHNPSAAHVVGIDLGGTTVLAGVADLSGRVLAEIEAPTSTDGGQAVVRQLATLAKEVARQARVPWRRVDAVSVGSPGVAATDGTMELASNVAGLGSTPLASELRRALRLPVAVDNDVNMAALGELQVGVAQKCRTFALLAIGTGVGLGLVVDGRLARGARGGAGVAGRRCCHRRARRETCSRQRLAATGSACPSSTGKPRSWLARSWPWPRWSTRRWSCSVAESDPTRSSWSRSGTPSTGSPPGRFGWRPQRSARELD